MSTTQIDTPAREAETEAIKQVVAAAEHAQNNELPVLVVTGRSSPVCRLGLSGVGGARPGIALIRDDHDRSTKPQDNPSRNPSRN
jgi:hypothetical protein